MTVVLCGCMQGTSQAGWSMPSSSEGASGGSRPAFSVTDDPPPEVIYNPGSRDGGVKTSVPTRLAPARISAESDQGVETRVTRKAADLNDDLNDLRGSINAARERLEQLRGQNDAAAAEYYGIVAGLNTELQSGTTPGNPILSERLSMAQERLNALSDDSTPLNTLAADLSNQASQATFLLDATQAAFALSGAVKEDHRKLATIEDGINECVQQINRLLIKVNDEISRRTTYMRAERSNLQTLALGIANGELYGQNLTNSLFRKATSDGQNLFKPGSNGSMTAPASIGSRRPLVIIRFDRPSVNYDQPLYTAISQALEKYPAAKFDLVAVSNLEGNAAQLALASAEARKNGEAVLRSLNQMGLPLERIRLSAANSKEVLNSEVHIYLQ